MKTLKLCVTLLALTISLGIGQTDCYAVEQTTEAVKENTQIQTENTVINEGYIDMWSIPVEERTDANFGPGFVNGVPKSQVVEIIDTTVSPTVTVQDTTSAVQPDMTSVLTPVEPVAEVIEVPEPPVKQRSVQSNRWGITLTQHEKDVLAQILYLEAGNQSDLGQQAVVEVVFNRIHRGGWWGDDCIEVLSKKGQFVTWSFRHKATVSAKEYRNIDAVLNGQTNILPFKTVFFSRGKQNNRVQTRIEDHVFCNE